MRSLPERGVRVKVRKAAPGVMGSLVLKMEGSHKPRNADSLKALEKARKQELLEGLWKHSSADTWVLGLLTSRNMRLTNLCCFKPPSLWEFLAVTTGNSYRAVVLRQSNFQPRNV